MGSFRMPPARRRAGRWAGPVGDAGGMRLVHPRGQMQPWHSARCRPPRMHPAVDSSTRMPLFQLRLAQLFPVRAPLRLTHDGSPNKCHQQRHHNAGRLEPALDTGCPLLVHAREVKRLDEPAEGRNGDGLSLEETFPGSRRTMFPCSLGNSSLAPSLFCSGPGECCNGQNTTHCLL